MKLTKLLVIVWASFSITYLPIQSCKAEASLSLDLRPAPVRWIPGPDKTTLGDVAEIEIPSGYRFTDGKGARARLESMKNPAPENIIGLLVPDNGGGWIMFEYTSIGYVRGEDGEKIDADGLLKSIRKTTEQQNQHRGMQNLPVVSLVDWESKPSYDSTKHILEWAIRAEYGPEVVVNHTVRFLGRNGVLDAIFVLPKGDTSTLAGLKQLLQGVSFKAGERYSDFQEGDKIAASGLVELTKADGSLNTPVASVEPEVKRSSHSFKSGALWIIACAVGLVGIVMLRRHSKHKHRDTRTNASAPVQKPKPLSPPVEVKNGINGSHTLNGLTHPVTDSHKQIFNHRSSKRKRRMFNYQKFYTDMMMQSASLSYSAGLTLKNGHQTAANGNGNGGAHTNGNGNHHDDDLTLNETVVLQATSELIASQKALIQEQARLIEDQSRLIEEKYRLLERQSELLVPN